MTTAYLIFKALHIIGAITWFAGLFYLPRLFIYHHAADDAISRERFEVMESKLMRIIMLPSAVVTVLFGLSMIALRWEYLATSAWLWVKLAFVALLIVYHTYCASIRAALAASSFTRDDRFLRLFNEVPVLPLIIIVFAAVLKPWQ